MSWGNPETTSERWRARLLAPAAAVYQAISSMHRLAYQASLLKSFDVVVPVISVGNITCGGTGKTPIVISLSRYFSDQEIKVGVLSRGFGKSQPNEITVVGDGNGNFAQCAQSGDEPLLIARSVPCAVVISGSDRVQAARIAIERFNCQALLLDDGFQHFRLKRQIDIVLIDYTDNPGSDALMPAGRLREPLTQLKRANHIIITKVPEQADTSKIETLKKVANTYAPLSSISRCRFTTSAVTFLSERNSGLPLEPAELSGKRVIAFCGLARSENFFTTVRNLGVELVAQRSFVDHHRYTEENLRALRTLKSETDAGYLITTEKDAVKLASLDNLDDILVLSIETAWIDNMPSAIRDLSAQIKSAADATRSKAEQSSPVNCAP
jgi:tetraacyldisaccharide 4'-kinase